MATCRDITKGALRKIGKLGAGREPRAADASDALEALRGLYRSLINSGAFGRLRDVIPTADYTAGENERIFRNQDQVLEITLPEVVSADLCGPRPYDEECDVYPNAVTDRNSRPPRDCAVVVIVDAFSGTTSDFIYDGHEKVWHSLYDLTDTSTAPLSFRDPEGLKALLAMQIVDEYGGTLGAATARQAGIFQSSLINRWSMPVHCSEYC
jgi:hypothetical protein